MIRFFLPTLSVLLILLALPAAAQSTVETTAPQAFMVDFDTGTVLLDKNADEKMPTSSMSKVITMYAVFDALKEGKISLTDTLPVSEKAWRMGGSKTFVELGNDIAVEDLIRGVVVQSGNDATVVLAEGLAGTEEGFADTLNALAAKLGMKDSHFMNASGWPDPDHYSTARDLTTLGVALIRDHPNYYPYFAELEFTYHNIPQGNRNPLLYKKIGADGIKTGHTEAAGYGLMGAGARDGRRVVFVINGLESMADRTEEATRILDWGLRSFVNKEIVAAEKVLHEVSVAYGGRKTVGMVAGKDILATLPRTQSEGYTVTLSFNAPVIAPVKAGDKIGEMILKIENRPDVVFPLFAAASVEEKSIFGKALENAKHMLLGP